MRVFVTHPVAPEVLAKIQDTHTLTLWAGPYPIPPRALADGLAAADGALVMLTDRVDEASLSRAPRLRIVANMAVGFDNIDREAASRRGILVTNTPDVLTEATAEFTWTLILALSRGLITARDALYAGHWTHWAPDGFLGRELYGKTLGIIGLGRIGGAVARRAVASGMEVVSLGPRGQGPYPRLSQAALLAASDVVSLHLPLSAETRHLADGAFFAAMKPGSYFINTARGGLVDEGALLSALDEGPVAGAALDVFGEEPIDGGHPLARHPRVLVTPHMGSATVETRTAMAERAANNLLAALSGRRPRDLVNPEAFPGRVGEGFPSHAKKV